MSFQQAGRRHVVADVGDEIFRDWLPAVVRRFFTPGARFQKRIRIVDSCGDVFSDPGANPGASTIRLASEANGAPSESSTRVEYLRSPLLRHRYKHSDTRNDHDARAGVVSGQPDLISRR